MPRKVFAQVTLAVLMLVPALVAVHATPAFAECLSRDSWPSFREEVASAKSVFVGTVVESLQELNHVISVRFRFRSDQVLRGHVPRFIDFGIVRPRRVLECQDSLLAVHVGDRLAFAYDEATPDTSQPPQAVGSVDPRPGAFVMPGIERLTLAEVQRLAGLPPTDAAIVATIGFTPIAPAIVGLGVAVGGWLTLRLRSRRRLRPTRIA